MNAKIMEDLSPFENKIIESLTIQLSYPDGKSILLTSVYRSNGILINMTSTEQMEKYLSKFDELAEGLRQKRKESIIFLDANIDLLLLHRAESITYLNLNFSH